MLVVAQRDVELGDRLARQQMLQIAHERVRGAKVDVEVGTREAEEDADVFHVGEDGVDDQARLGVE